MEEILLSPGLQIPEELTVCIFWSFWDRNAVPGRAGVGDEPVGLDGRQAQGKVDPDPGCTRVARLGRGVWVCSVDKEEP